MKTKHIILTNDPDVIAYQRFEEAEEYFTSQMIQVVILMLNEEITPAEGRVRVEKLKAQWKREIEEIKKL